MAVKVKSNGTGPGRTQSVVDREPLLQHVQSCTLFLDAIWLTQMGALGAKRWKCRNVQECDSERKPRYSAYRLSITSYVRCPSLLVAAQIFRNSFPSVLTRLTECGRDERMAMLVRSPIEILGDTENFLAERVGH